METSGSRPTAEPFGGLRGDARHAESAWSGGTRRSWLAHWGKRRLTRRPPLALAGSPLLAQPLGGAVLWSWLPLHGIGVRESFGESLARALAACAVLQFSAPSPFASSVVCVRFMNGVFTVESMQNSMPHATRTQCVCAPLRPPRRAVWRRQIEHAGSHTSVQLDYLRLGRRL